jgi:hypothetical protein
VQDARLWPATSTTPYTDTHKDTSPERHPSGLLLPLHDSSSPTDRSLQPLVQLIKRFHLGGREGEVVKVGVGDDAGGSDGFGEGDEA